MGAAEQGRLRPELLAAKQAVGGRIDPELYSRVALERGAAITDSYTRNRLADTWARAVLGVGTRDRTRGTHAVVAGAVAAATGGLPAVPQLFAHLPTRLRPLPPQVLVDLLKHPFCLAAERRVVLDALGLTYGRYFRDQWEFIRFVRERNLPLDLLTPPRRPADGGR